MIVVVGEQCDEVPLPALAGRVIGGTSDGRAPTPCA